MAKAPPKAAVKKAAPAGKPTKRRKVNKSQAIREFKAKNPSLGPTEIAKALTAKGIPVSAPQVSNALIKKKKKKRKKRGPKKIVATKAANTVSLDSLIDAQKFVEKVGGVDAAKDLLGAIEKLSK